MWVLHKCDNAKCANVEHLFLGTDSDNSRDKVRKHRHHIGTQIVIAKMDEDKVRKLRSMYTGKYGDKNRLARLFGIGRTAVDQIVTRKTWQHVS